MGVLRVHFIVIVVNPFELCDRGVRKGLVALSGIPAAKHMSFIRWISGNFVVCSSPKSLRTPPLRKHTYIFHRMFPFVTFFVLNFYRLFVAYCLSCDNITIIPKSMERQFFSSSQQFVQITVMKLAKPATNAYNRMIWSLRLLAITWR